MLPCNHVYPLWVKETQAIDEYIMEALDQGYICLSTSSASVGFFFVEIKEYDSGCALTIVD